MTRSLAVHSLVALALGCGGAMPPAPAGEAVAVLDTAVLDTAGPPAARLADVLSALDGRPFVPLSGGAELRWSGSRHDVERLVDAGLARFAEPIVEFSSDFIPSDPGVREQWALDDIDALRAWDQVPSARRVVVAVVDSGVHLDHPDLADALWTNEREVPGNGIDDDGNGFVDDVHGWDFVDDDADPSPDGASAAANHGTHVAGIVGAVTGNRIGIAGVAPGALVMPVRAMADASGRSDWIADGIDYAVQNGARVVNLSLGGSYSRLVDDAIGRAWKAGVAVVAAAGNNGREGASFPASSRSPGVLGVAAAGMDRRLASFSNHGSGVDLTAPGLDIFSTYGERGYRAMSGTSMAAPHVAGALALRLASRGSAGHGSLSAMLDALPVGPSGMPRLDLASVVEPAAGGDAAAAPLTSRRTRLAFQAVTAARRPPPQTIALGALAPTPFHVEAPAWVKPGRCRIAPCRWTVGVDPAGLRPGPHEATVRLVPEAGAEPLLLAVSVQVGRGQHPLVIEATHGKERERGAQLLRLVRGEPVSLTVVRDARRTTARWTIDEVAYDGSALNGAFPRAGSYIVRAATDAGEEALLPVIVADGGAGAAAGVGVPDGG